MDYGNRSEVPLNKLKEIPKCLQGLPFQVGVMLLAVACWMVFVWPGKQE